MNKIERIKELVKKLDEYRDSYYNKNISIISDKEYDRLFDELKAFEQDTGYILANSPTQEVGYIVKSKLAKRTHPTLLKSLDKTKSIDELNKFKGNREVILMLKADGLTVEVDYENGILTGAYTRGNSEIGEDITHNALTFKNLPKQISYKGKLRLCGEAAIHWDDFNKINEILPEEDKYATPRNLTSGSVRQLNSEICAARNVYWYAFNILECEDEFSNSKADNFHKLIDMGFSIIPFLHKDIDIGEKTIEYMKKQAAINNIPIDGLVISFNSVEYSNSLGEVAHHPLHSLAFKFSDETEETILRSIEWNTTRSGQINPTACFDTVILDNTEVSRASLFNLTFIKDLQLNLLNRISVSKRNQIIPYVEENLERQKGGYILIPERCPSCGHETKIRNTGTADFLFCKNDNCPAKLLDKFVHFCTRDAMNVEGLSEATLEKFINKGWLKAFDDIYKLYEHRNEIINMEGFGDKSYTKLVTAIEKTKNVEFANFIYALGINQIGKGGAKRLAKHFNNDIKTFLRAVEEQYDFTIIEDYGRITSDSILYYFDNPVNYATVLRLLEYIKIKQEEKTQPIGLKDLSGLIFVITGAVYSFKNREQFKILVESLNGKVAGGISSRTNYLVCNEDAGSSKSQKAKALGVTVITEDEFNKMIGRNM